ncbi:hypothetical protein [Streptomyces sp. NRRL S-337]|uniref:hypothetical protein n=1 Tax=Streptomyces sp. NRRL S-337 TaxID=1463900 RepID=UPI003B639680
MSLPQEDVAFVDEYAAETGAGSRSAALHAAIELLRASRHLALRPRRTTSSDTRRHPAGPRGTVDA